MKQIETLVPDIYELIERGVDPAPAALEELGSRLAQSIASSLKPRDGGSELRMSNLGTPCERKLWYSLNQPEDAEALRGPARIKFLFGHILEDLVLWLAEQAGHKVEGRQDECEIGGVKGHRDAVIDGELVDVKSASTYSYKKFDANDLVGNDGFGYLTQLGGYLAASRGDPLVKKRDRASFLVVDKTLGNICLDTYKFPEYNYYKMVEEKREMLAKPNPPPRGYDSVPEGKSGNRKLGVGCSYCSFKGKCWPGLRTFIYASGPMFLVQVAKAPNVPEVVPIA